jgi:hypothetical protein
MDLGRKLERLHGTGAPAAEKKAARPVPAPERLVCTFPGELELGGVRLGELTRLSPERLRILCGLSAPLPDDPARLLFWDTETTGLGGSGTIVFLAGFLSLTAAGVLIEQYFLPDPGAEPVFLQLLAEKMAGDPVLVSYNGRAFDSHALENRFILNHLSPPPMTPHLDLIHPARNAFRELEGDCSLKHLERARFALQRPEGDIPGALVPAQYAAFVRSGNRELIEPVLEHNRYDLLSLALLALQLPRLVDSAPESLPPRALTLLGRRALAAGDAAEAERLFETARRTGAAADRLRIFLLRKRRLLAEDDMERLGAEAERLYREAGTLPEAAVEWAKYLEHVEKNFSAATKVAEAALTGCPAGSNAAIALRDRLGRLKRKLYAAADGRGPVYLKSKL